MLPLSVLVAALLIALNLGSMWFLLRTTYFGVFAAPHFGRLIAAVIAFAIVEAVLLAVWMIAIQRYLLLSERPTLPTIMQNPHRVLRYAGFLAVVIALWRLVPMLLVFPDFQLPVTEGSLLALAQALYFFFLLLPYVFLLLFAILFPLLAVADAAKLQAALSDTRRGLWRIFLVFIFTQLPFVALAWIAIQVPKSQGAWPSEIDMIIATVIFTASMAVYAASCTYFYACYAKAAHQPAVSATG
jgi:hypothetical protein